MANSRFHISIATAMRRSIKGYNLSQLRQDAVAGFTVSMIALPLAMALSIAVGLPPQHGIYTAIIAGIVTALLGGSTVQVSGPTAAFVVIIAPIVSQHGLHGLIWCQIMAGFVLLAMGVARFGRYINYIPYPVTTGFTAGIALVIATIALNDFLGLGIEQLQGSYLNKLSIIMSQMPDINPYEAMIGGITLLFIAGFGKITRTIPSSVAGIVTGTLIAWFLTQYGYDITTIDSRFTYMSAEGMKHGIPPYPPTLHLPNNNPDSLWRIPDYAEFRQLVTPALVVAVLAALESLLSASVADSMIGSRHNPNAELNAVGAGNIFSALAGGIPATGAIARTAANIHAGGKTPIAAVIHALLIMLYVLLLAPLIGYVPMSSLAALLLITAWRMSHIKQFSRMLRTAPSSDIIVLIACFSLTVFIDMIAGVSVGIVLAAFLFMKRIAQLTSVQLGTIQEAENGITPPPLPDNTMIYSINGPLFFGTVEKAYDRYNFIHDHITRLIIDMEHVPLIDMTGLMAMKSMCSSIAREGREIILCGKPEITTRILNQLSPATAQHIHTSRTVASFLETL